MIATILYMAVSHTYAQTATIPNPSWPSDSVINGSIKHFDVQGDLNYTEASTFTWTVYGGRLFFDEALTTMAGDGTTVTIPGNSSNATEIWVIWDVFTKPLDYGYIYVTELSADGCEKWSYDNSKYSGLNITVIAPPDIRFLSEETLTCSNEDGVTVEIEIDGFAPFDLKYSLNGEIIDWHVEPGEMVDSDFDGKANNLTLVVDDYAGTTVPMVYEFELIEAVSEGVAGEVLDFPTHTVYAFVQPDAPEINPYISEITTGQSHPMNLLDEGFEVAEWYWEVYDIKGNLHYESSSETESSTIIPFDIFPGEYIIYSYFKSINGCLSLPDSHPVTVYPLPTIAFSDNSDHAAGCSAISTDPDDAFEFTLNYQGALPYIYTYDIYDYNNVLLEQIVSEYELIRNPTIIIPNTFVNDVLPEANRIWRVVISSSQNGEGVDVEVLDSFRPGGRDEMTITIHPLPIITDDIDFHN